MNPIVTSIPKPVPRPTQSHAEIQSRLAAIVESSDDAISSRSLEGVISVTISPPPRSSCGACATTTLQLVCTLAEQLDAEIVTRSSNGATIETRFSLRDAE